LVALMKAKEVSVPSEDALHQAWWAARDAAYRQRPEIQREIERLRADADELATQDATRVTSLERRIEAGVPGADQALYAELDRQAITGTATGLDSTGSRTMTARTTQLFPYPVFAGPGADPSWNHNAAQTFLPRLLNRVSSTTAPAAWPSGTSRDTTSRATASPRSSGFPPGAGEEGVRTVMRPQAGKPRPGQHRASPAARETRRPGRRTCGTTVP
jgi:hypothetical protein